jgi:hypothetical protein
MQNITELQQARALTFSKMKKTINLNAAILISIALWVLSAVLVALQKPFFNFLATGLVIYFMAFLLNRFYNLAVDHNALTKFLLGNRKFPLYAVTATAILVMIFRRAQRPEVDLISTYTAMSLGVITGVIAFLKGVDAQKG